MAFINCLVISLSNAFSKFPVIRHIPCLTYAIFSETNFRNRDSDLGGIIVDVEGTGPELIETIIPPIFSELSVTEIKFPFSKFSI